ncbi:hypothetical protein LCGC14_0852200 [marine sediment metagenome]|uniref:Uncharacterized protein n=1 Tax=marine sediment metagenome TaxID=412755 RepID=A0A0F9PV74_9ZZZZ
MPKTLRGPEYTADESVTVSTASKALTSGTYGLQHHAFITCETASVRFWLDGMAPTSSVGHQLDAGDTLTLDSPAQIVNVRFIRKDGTDATLRVSYGT